MIGGKRLAMRTQSKRRLIIKKLLVLVFSLALARWSDAVAAQVKSSEEEYARLISEGQKAAAAGRQDDAIKDFLQALQLKPGDAMLRTKVGGIYYERKE